MKIICISGKAQNGKDHCAKLIKKELEDKSYKILIAHYADLLKYICKTFFEWDGEKDIYGRTLLQHIGQYIREKTRNNYWVNFLIGIFNLFHDEWDYVIIPDTRFPNEIDLLKEYYDVTTVRVTRPNYDNGLTEEQQNHESEIALDDYKFDYQIVNNGNATIQDEIDRFMTWLYERND